jgi:hypothetical protein
MIQELLLGYPYVDLFRTPRLGKMPSQKYGSKKPLSKTIKPDLSISFGV